MSSNGKHCAFVALDGRHLNVVNMVSFDVVQHPVFEGPAVPARSNSAAQVVREPLSALELVTSLHFLRGDTVRAPCWGA